MKRIISLILITIMLNGCASFSYRSGDSYPSISPGPYPATRVDVDMMKNLSEGDYDPLLTGAENLVFTLYLLDTPFSLIMDTICLPFDVFQIEKEEVEKKENGGGENE